MDSDAELAADDTTDDTAETETTPELDSDTKTEAETAPEATSESEKTPEPDEVAKFEPKPEEKKWMGGDSDFLK
jgi:hypothetical protein